MYSFTVYQSKTQPTFRVVAGDHPKFAKVDNFSVRIYQGADRQAAIDAAFAGETDEKIKAQIARFGVTPGKIACGYSDCEMTIPPKYGKPGVALSRHDNKTLICSDCGLAEALSGKPKNLLRKSKRVA